MAAPVIRAALETDLPAIAALIRALAAYEHLEHAVTFTDGDLRTHLFGAMPRAEVLVAVDDSEDRKTVVGFALFFHTFSTFLGKPGIYLEDLFVTPPHRGRGHGKALISEVASLAMQRGCGRLEWAVLDWNQPAISFYESLGAAPLDDWTTFRLTGSALEALGRSPKR